MQWELKLSETSTASPRRSNVSWHKGPACIRSRFASIPRLLRSKTDPEDERCFSLPSTYHNFHFRVVLDHMRYHTGNYVSPSKHGRPARRHVGP